MKSITYKVLFLVVVVIVAIAAGHAQAGVISSYDFNSLNAGALNGQDGWDKDNAVYSSPEVFAPTSGDNLTNVLRYSGTTTDDSVRHSPTFTFTSIDTAIEFHFWAYSGNNSGGIYAGLAWADSAPQPPLPNMGLVVHGGAMTTYVREGSASHTEYFGTALTNGHWYELKAVMDFSTAATATTMWYRDITAGQLTFTQDATMGTRNLNVPTTNPGTYTANGYSVRIDKGTQISGAYVQYLDNYSVVDPKVIPEPSTLALLAAGLVGLLAYAWRKRK